MIEHDVEPYFSGRVLFGDDFDREQLEQWFEDEREAYADLGAGDSLRYQYVYHELNHFHGFRYLSTKRFGYALGFGSAYGDEFIPIANQISGITIVEPSGAFEREEVSGVPVRFVKPSIAGTLPFEDGTFDLITCLDVLHHIPNVTYVVNELARVLRVGGTMLLREPVISMGDWRRPRPGLTKRERGIPERLLDEMLQGAGLQIVHSSMCMFPVVPRICALLGFKAFNSKLATRLDAICSRLFHWNLSYHDPRPLKKFRPTVKFYVLERPALGAELSVATETRPPTDTSA